jgi:hypothetical protein
VVAFLADTYQSGGVEHCQMLGDGAECNVKSRRNLTGCHLPVPDQQKDGSATRLGHHLEKVHLDSILAAT